MLTTYQKCAVMVGAALAALLVAVSAGADATPSGTFTQLTNDDVWDQCPVYSPSGHQIAFIKVGSDFNELWVMNSDGSGQVKLSDGQITGCSMEWSPDSQRLIFSKDQHIVDLTLRTGVIRDVAPGSAFSLSPNGHRIAFTAPTESGFAIFVEDTNGEHVENLTPDLSYASGPAWSPNGRKIAFSGGNGPYALMVMNDDGSNVSDLTAAYPELWASQFPVWSPNGQKIVFEGWLTTGESEVFVINADGSGLIALSPPGYLWKRAWSPDGKLIAFDSDNNVMGDLHVYTVRPDGSDLREIAGGYNPSWTPNSHLVAFAGRLDGGFPPEDIYTVTVPRPNEPR